MSLSADLISQFVKATKDDKKTKSETTVYGTVVEYAGSNYVKFDGSDLLTPVETTVDAEPGDRVTVLLKDHTATVTGNVSSPAARRAAVQLVVNNVTELETVLADFITVDELSVESARIDSLDAENANIKQTLTAHDADITTLEAEVARIDELVVTDADITNLQADVVTVKETLTAHNASIETLEAEVAKIDDLVVNNAAVTELQADVARIDEALVGKLSATDIEGKYANIDFSNISKATMGEFYANSGLIQNVVVGDATITGNLVGVTISGDLIETNTLVADKLVIQGEDGLYYALNTNGMSVEAEQTDYNSLDGSVIKAQSITATKINVDDLVAFDATVGGFKITADSLYSGVKESVDNTTRGVYLDNDGQMAFGDANRYVKYYQDTDDTYKLDICADGVKFAATGTDLASGVYGIVSGPSTIEMREDIDALEVRVTDAETKIEQNSEAITLSATKTEVATAKSEAISEATTKANDALASANANTADLLESYSTTTQMNSAIELKADSITNTVSATYATKTELSTTNDNVTSVQNEVDSIQENTSKLDVRLTSAETSIGQNSDAIALRATKTEVNNTLKSYYTKEESDAALTVSANEITSTVSNTYATKSALATIDANVSAAQEEVDDLKDRVGAAETNISQNTDAIALRATKTELATAKSEAISTASSDATTKANNALSSANANTASLLNNYSTTVEMNSAIELKADSINSSVSSTYATKSALSTTNTRMSTVEQTASGLTTRLTTAESDILDAAKTATDYLNLSTAGLVVGQNPTNPTAGNTLISTNGVTIRKGTTVLSEFKAATRTASGITSATISSSDITDSESDGVTSVSGTVKRNESRANVYISTNGNPVYFPNGIETDKVLINDNGIISNDNILLDGSIVDSSGEGIFTPLNSYGNTIIGYGRYQDGGGTHVYGARVKAKTKSGFSASVNGVAAIETDNSSGNATFGWHHYNASEGETTIYGNIVGLASKEDIRINSSGNHIRFDGNIVPYTTNKYNLGNPSLAIRDIHISSVNDGTAHGISFSSGSGSDNAVGVNASGYRIFGNTSYCTNIVTKSTTTTNTGYSFKITCGDNPTLVIGDNDARLFLFGGTDTTSRYIGSMAAYKRTYTASANMCVTENGIIGRTTSSSERYKKDIDIASIDELKGLYDLPVKKFKYRDGYIADDDELYDKYLYGFIVEDLETILPCAVQHITDENGEKLPEMWNNNILVPSLFKLVQDLNNRLKIIEMGG